MMKLQGPDPLGNPIVLGCPYPEWCRFEPGPTHRHSLVTQEDVARAWRMLPFNDRLTLLGALFKPQRSTVVMKLR